MTNIFNTTQWTSVQVFQRYPPVPGGLLEEDARTAGPTNIAQISIRKVVRWCNCN
ncbi:unnamed protein product [Amoebophrya sp. A25]|nr:unnamed protein product [Amoebophrya sp. A25]|eukprot:GSA25T00008628001.1